MPRPLPPPPAADANADATTPTSRLSPILEGTEPPTSSHDDNDDSATDVDDDLLTLLAGVSDSSLSGELLEALSDHDSCRVEADAAEEWLSELGCHLPGLSGEQVLETVTTDASEDQIV